MKGTKIKVKNLIKQNYNKPTVNIVGASLVSVHNKTNYISNESIANYVVVEAHVNQQTKNISRKFIANVVGEDDPVCPPFEDQTQNKKSSKTYLNLISKLQSLTSATKGITLIALIITIIVMLILVGVTLSIALNGGLIGKANEAVEETEKSQFIENANLAYTDLYLQKVKESKSELITLEELTTKLINDYGYAEKITKVATNGVTDITLNPESLTLEPGKSGTVAVTFGENKETTEAYIKIRGWYYKISLEGTKVVLGEKQSQIQTGENTVAELIAESNNEKVTATVEDTNIKIEAGAEASAGDTKVTVKYGTITKEIIVTITGKKGIKLDKDYVSFNDIDEKTITLTAILTNLTGPVNWKSSRDDVATVTKIDDMSASITYVNDGLTIISAECGGYVAECTVTSGELSMKKAYATHGHAPVGLTLSTVRGEVSPETGIIKGICFGFHVSNVKTAVLEWGLTKSSFSGETFFTYDPPSIKIDVSEYETEFITKSIKNYYISVNIKGWIDYVLEHQSSYSELTIETARRSKEAYDAYLASVERTIGGYEGMI